MFCGKCGASLPDDAVRCSECGAPVKIRPEAADLRKTGQAFFKAPDTEELESRESSTDKMPTGPEADGTGAEARVEEAPIRLIGEETGDGHAEARPGREKETPADPSADQNGRKKGSGTSSARRSGKKKNPSGSPASRKSGKKSPAQNASGESAGDRTDRKKTTAPAREMSAVRTKKAPAEETERAAAEPARPVRTDMPAMSREEYLASLPAAEKIRRRIQESLHRYGEAADARNMRRQLERAEKFYHVEPENEEKTLSPGTIKKALSAVPKKQTGEVPAAVPEKQTGEVPAAVSEKQAGKAAAAGPDKQTGKAAAADPEKETGKKSAAGPDKQVRKTISADRIREEIEEMAAREREEKVRSRLAAAEASAGNRPGPEQAGGEAGKETGPVTADSEISTGTEAAEAAPSGHPDRDMPEETPSVLFKAPSGEELLDENPADREEPGETAETDRTPEAAAPASVPGQDTAAAREQKSAEAGTGLSDEEILALARKALADREAAALTAEEQRAEDARIVRRYQEDLPDRLDQALSRYGLSKEAAVRLATLFLIAVLSMVYVLGRGHQPSPLEDVPVAGDGMTGAPAYAEPQAGDTSQEAAPEGAENPEGEAEAGESENDGQ